MFSQMRDTKKHGKGIANDKGNRTRELFYRTELTMAKRWQGKGIEGEL